jgi:dolichol-phosphate mannosyltransferase
VLFDRDGRMHGEASYTFKKLAKLALDGITSFSNFPLKLASWMGFVVSGVAFLILLYALIAKLMYMVPINGWTSLMIVVSFLGGIQLLTLGIIGEYISRINEEVRNRPVYVVDEKSLEKGAESNKAQ